MIDTQALFHVSCRKKLGKAAKSVTRDNYILANIYGLGKASEAIQIKKDEVRRLITGNFDTGLIYVEIDGQSAKIPVLVDEIARHSVSQAIQHVVLRRVDLKEEIETEVAIKLVGECEIIDATPVLVMDSVTIKTIPANIPESIEVDVSGFTQVGQSIMASQLVLPENTKLVVGEDEDDSPVVVLQTTKVEEPVEEVLPAEAEGAEGESTEETAKAEGQETKDGDQTKSTDEPNDKKTKE